VNLCLAPLQSAVFLASTAVLNGARNWKAIIGFVRGSLMEMLKVSWTTSPLALAIAQSFLPSELWDVWFNLVGFVVGEDLSNHPNA